MKFILTFFKDIVKDEKMNLNNHDLNGYYSKDELVSILFLEQGFRQNSIMIKF